MNSADFTYGWALLFLFTVLESLLGILIACLPVIQPVRMKLIDSAFMSWIGSKISDTLGSSGSRNKASSGGNSSARNFDRLPEPLYRGENDFETHNAVESHSMGDLEDQDLILSKVGPQGNTIQVTKGWDIHSQ